MLENSSTLVLNNSAYILREQWIELKKFSLQRRGLPLVFAALLESVTKEFINTRLRPLQRQVTGLDDDRNVVMRPRFQPATNAS